MYLRRWISSLEVYPEDLVFAHWPKYMILQSTSSKPVKSFIYWVRRFPALWVHSYHNYTVSQYEYLKLTKIRRLIIYLYCTGCFQAPRPKRAEQPSTASEKTYQPTTSRHYNQHNPAIFVQSRKKSLSSTTDAWWKRFHFSASSKCLSQWDHSWSWGLLLCARYPWTRIRSGPSNGDCTPYALLGYFSSRSEKWRCPRLAISPRKETHGRQATSERDLEIQIVLDKYNFKSLFLIQLHNDEVVFYWCLCSF